MGECLREPDLRGNLRCYLGCLDAFKNPTGLREHLTAPVTDGGHELSNIVIKTMLHPPEIAASSTFPDTGVLSAQQTQLMIIPALSKSSSILPTELTVTAE